MAPAGSDNCLMIFLRMIEDGSHYDQNQVWLLWQPIIYYVLADVKVHRILISLNSLLSTSHSRRPKQGIIFQDFKHGACTNHS